MPKKNSRPGKTGIYVELPNELLEALDARRQAERRPRTTEIIIALEKHLGVSARQPRRKKDDK